MSKRKGILISLILILLIIGSLLYNQKNVDSIDTILTKESYSYLPKEAKEYIKQVYEDSGEVVLTEKNKQENVPYLNPKYVYYLTLDEEEQEEVEVIPNPFVVDFVETNTYSDTSMPSYYNLSNLNGESYITPFYNQGSLGICWSFASIEQVESYLMVNSGNSYSTNTQKFSSRQMDYATSTNGINNYENENGYRELTEGGNFYLSSEIMSNALSLVDYNNMPFDESTDTKELAEVLNYKNSKYEVDKTILMPNLSSDATDEDITSYINEIKQNIINYGGAYVGTASPQGACAFKNSDNKYVIVDADDCVGTSGHAMQIIGWDDDYEYSYCQYNSNHLATNKSGKCSKGTLVSKTGAWILRNSWGDSEDYEYVYLGYNSYDIEVGFSTEISSMEDKSWDNNYHINFWGDKVYYYESQTLSFDKSIDTSEKVEKVKFMAYTSGGTYNLTIKTGNKTYSNVASITTEYPGIYTIDLSSLNVILDSSSFSVTLKSKNGGSFVQNTISVFTSNIDDTPVIKTSDLDGSTISVNEDKTLETLVYSSTKNIDSNETVKYELYKNGIDCTSYIDSYINNVVAKNDINATIVFNKDIIDGTYILKTIYNDYEFESNITINSGNSLEGDGTEENPYKIYTEDDLYLVRYNLESYYSLQNDITLQNNLDPIGTELYPFKGGFDGNGYTISNINISSNLDNAVGLFGYVQASSNTYIKNLYIKEAKIENNGNAGILVGNLTFNNSNLNVTIDNVHLIDGSVTSKNGDSGSLIGNISILKNSNSSTLNINNTFSSATITGLNSEGLIGYVNDSVLSSSSNMININLSNFQNAGTIITNKEYSLNDYYSPVFGGIYGNVKITLNNYIVNSIFDTYEYKEAFKKNNNSYFIGYYDENTSNNLKIDYTNGYFVGYDTTSSKIKDSSLYSSWTDFSKYWKIEEIDGIIRIPVLKNINYNYTSYNEDISIKLYNSAELDYINSNLQYTSFSVVSNDSIVEISNTYPYSINALSKGTAIIHVVNDYDGFEKDININVTADKKEEPTITYYYDSTSNTDSYTQTIKANTSFNLKSNEFTKEGYKLVGWNTLSNGKGITYQADELIEEGIDEDLHLYAMWEKILYTIIFDSNGAEGSMSNITGYYDTEITLSNNLFTRNYYKFLNWNTSSDGKGTTLSNNETLKIGSLNSESETITLYAIWEQTDYIIKFDSNGAEGSMDNIAVEKSKTVNLPSVTFTKTDYKFKEWNTSSDGKGIAYLDNASITPESDMTLYAIWKINVGTITFDANTVTKNTNTQKFTFDEDTKLNDNTFTRENYEFKSWNTNSDGSGTTYTNEQVINIHESITLYAIWEQTNYIIKFDSNGADGSMNDFTVEKNKTVNLPSVTFTKTNYKFKEWNTSSDGKGIAYLDNASITPESDMTLYAIWKINVGTITFNSNDGANNTKTQNITFDTDTKLNKNTFTRSGYEFISWNTSSDGKGTTYTNEQVINITSSINLYAIWNETFDYVINNYTVDKVNNYISKIMVNTSVSTYKNSIKVNDGYSVDVDYKTINGNKLLYTGGTTKIYKGQSLYAKYTNVVIGDINGDGAINSADLLRIRQHLLKTKTLSGEYFLSADINYDNTINSADLLRIRQHLLGTKPIS